MVSRIGKEIEISPVELGSQIAKRVKINMASGTPDPRKMPIKEIKDAYSEVLNELGPKVLFYPGAGGQEELIREIEDKFLSVLNLTKRKDEKIVVTSGAQHAMELLGKYFLENDVIAVENPTFIETFNALKLRSSSVIPISLDPSGIDVNELETLLKVVKIRLLYVIPNCHNPAGVNMSECRRKRLIELAEKYDFYIIEDDPYRPIAGETPQPIKNYDNNGRVIYVSSFSKIIAPGLRVGFLIAKEDIAEKISLMEQLDFSTSTINQYVVARLLRKGVVTERSKELYEHYKSKMKILVDSLVDKGLDKFNEPKCGFFLLLDVGKDSWNVFHKAVEKGLSFVPAKPFFLRGGDTMARLSVSVATKEEIIEGVKILNEVIRNI
ncbi:PLP-dependent aminotransferase family protein [Saccharolobus solfataricus]|uniref:Aspartate aminotransferase (AspB-4) n=3 Tax=Saccharolobus solfataricus TaxID=2287 RepID=Q97TY7_SACS2|nr:PLP-dependent aminotransferase family protein [Saccharolobus solfataricus]AAK43337.1 Aspartate aminotransferase (aspB-4) [Saccharolobus solfataricus P2]AKA73354.1 PLP-dependent aminotransferase family protein [Saccharolobus solfataricus]AKA76053.1 PLP-dependent aminotransferase family protein [Saccharolobus solfataricus]AKA78746.1 PLP-dependent aminotransferase family protein [Saccharolobus solfataricus]AZF67822.1 PLP-dependent aminotransferase family protein [Saccharolobus solfataricus]